MELAGTKVGLDEPFFLIAGPCVVESRDLCFEELAPRMFSSQKEQSKSASAPLAKPLAFYCTIYRCASSLLL